MILILALNTVFSPIPASGSAGHPVTNTEAVVFGIDVKYGIDYLSRSFKEDFEPRTQRKSWHVCVHQLSSHDATSPNLSWGCGISNYRSVPVMNRIQL